jgi:hypothetical protein
MCISLGMLPLGFDHVDALTTLNVYANSTVEVLLHFLLYNFILKAQSGSRSRTFGLVASNEKTRAQVNFSGALQTAAKIWSAASCSGKMGNLIT